MGHHEHKKHAVENIGFALVTVSDTRTVEDDESGKLIIKLIEGAGHHVVSYNIVKDTEKDIRFEAERVLVKEDVSAAIFCGGTGVAARDVTIETIKPLFEKELSGFGEIFRVMSLEEIGSAAIMSRATAGVRKGKVIFCIPGSKGAVNLALNKLILEECGHILWEANK